MGAANTDSEPNAFNVKSLKVLPAGIAEVKLRLSETDILRRLQF